MGLTRIRAQQISNIDFKQAVRVITLSNITLADGAPSTVDGVSLLAGDRILVNGQTDASQNGLYIVQSVGQGENGTWVRSTDADTTGEILPGMTVMVTEGNVYADTPWKLVTNGDITVGVTELTFKQNYSLAFGNVWANGVAVIANTVADTVSFTATGNVIITANSVTKTIDFDSVGGGGLDATKIESGTSNVAVISSGGNVDVNVDGNSIVTFHAGGIDNRQANGVGNIGTDTNSFDTVFAKSTSAQYADVAERYQADAAYSPGTVVEIGGTHEITATHSYGSARIAGVVSTAPAFIMNSQAEGTNTVSVALLGRVPCRVIAPIQKGDLVTSSNEPGAAARMDLSRYTPGCVIGKALEDYLDMEREGKIEILVGKT